MTAGRRPLPTKMKLLRGNPGGRPLNANEPQPTPAIPKCPSHLDKVAKKEWRRISQELFDAGLLTVADRAALAAYCQVYSRWIDCEQILKTEGMVVKAPSGYPILNPHLTISQQCVKQMRQYLIEFGMTPASRSRLDIAPIAPKSIPTPGEKGAPDPTERLLFGDRGRG